MPPGLVRGTGVGTITRGMLEKKEKKKDDVLHSLTA